MLCEELLPQKSPILCIKFLSEKAPMLSVKFVLIIDPHVVR